MSKEQFKQAAAAAAKAFFSEAQQQSDPVLAARIGVQSEHMNNETRKLAALWYAAQKMYLLSQKMHQVEEQTTYLQGVLDVLKRCNGAITDPELPVKVKIERLQERVKLSLNGSDEDRRDLARDERAAFDQFYKQQEQYLTEKLRYMPDDKLVKGLQLQAEGEIKIPELDRAHLQRYIHLQTLFDSCQQMGEFKLGFAEPVLAKALVPLKKVSVGQGHLNLSFRIHVLLLWLRFCQWSMQETDQLPIASKELDELIERCFALGFHERNSDKGFGLTLNNRGFFIGQGLSLMVEFNRSVWRDFCDSLASGPVDLPAVARLHRQQCLLVTMPRVTEVAKVAVSMSTLEGITRHLPIRWLEYYEVPSDRHSLKLSQMKQMQNELKLASTLEEANAAAYVLFMTLLELSSDQGLLFEAFAAVKSILRRKNLKLVWHEQSPFWTLKLRTALDGTWQNQPLPRADLVKRLLQRYEF